MTAATVAWLDVYCLALPIPGTKSSIDTAMDSSIVVSYTTDIKACCVARLCLILRRVIARSYCAWVSQTYGSIVGVHASFLASCCCGNKGSCFCYCYEEHRIQGLMCGVQAPQDLTVTYVVYVPLILSAQKPCTCSHILSRVTTLAHHLCVTLRGMILGCCCRLWKQAYYNANNCEALVSCAAELQGLVLTNSSLAARPTLMANLLEAVTEVKEFVATFSER